MIPTHLFLYQHLVHSAKTCPDQLAVEDQVSRLTYAGLHSEALHIAQDLRAAGIGQGDRVILFMDNSVEFARGFWGILYAGGVVTPVSADMKTEKLAWILADCRPKAILTDAAHSPIAKEAALSLTLGVQPVVTALQANTGKTQIAGVPPCQEWVIDQDLACIIYTSGSTGHPKGVMLSQQNLVSASRSVCTYLGYTAQDRIFVALPLTFDYGLHQLTMAALVGATVLIERNFAKPLFVLHRLAQAHATVFPIVPTMVPLIDVLASRFDLSCLRIITSTAAALHPQSIERLAAHFPKAQVFSMYGLTECHRCSYLPPSELKNRSDSVGIAIPNTELWVQDSAGNFHQANATGELVVRGSTVMKGYWNNPQQTGQRLKPGPVQGERALFTGDLCQIDADGFLYFLSRTDDILKIRGEKVAPKEIEDALLSHPCVSEAAVLGILDAHGECQVRALVTLHPETQTDHSTLKDWCALNLEPIAQPRKIEIRQAFERTANGKIDRQLLLQTLSS